jgi:hypothetical protein
METKIIEMNEKYAQLKTTLENSSKNIDEFMKGKVNVFGEDTFIEKGSIYDSLIADDVFDDKVEMFLEVLLPAMTQLCQKLFKDHLPGGAHTALPTETVEKLTGIPKTCTDSIKPSLQFLCNFVVINASEGSLCFQIFLHRVI